MRTASRYTSRKVSSGVPVHTLFLLVGLALALCVMMWSLHIVQHNDPYLHPRRLGEGGIVTSEDEGLSTINSVDSGATSSLVTSAAGGEESTNRITGSGGGTGATSSETAIATSGGLTATSTSVTSDSSSSVGSTSSGSQTTTSTSTSTGTGISTGSDTSSVAISAGSSSASDHCHMDDRNEYHGDVVLWGDKNVKSSAEECCQSCSSTPGCNIWVYCGREEGCGHGVPRPKGECWLKRNTLSYIISNMGQGHSGITWTAGSVYSATEYEQYVKEHEAAVKAEAERLRKLRDDPELPLVWLEVALNGTVLGRIEMVLFVKDAPRAAENMRLLCSGEKGRDERGRLYHLKGAYFYRIIDRFIDQTGAEADGIFDGDFHDDPGGLKLRHTHKGLLSMANAGPNTNGGHFSLIMGPAHHLDGSYTIFGEIVSGLEHAEKINTLAKGQANNELLHSTLAQIVDAGQTRPGTYISTPEFRAVIEAEKRRVAWRKTHPYHELRRLRTLFEDQSLPMVYLDIAIKGVYAGRIEAVLFLKDAPLAAENFRLLCTGELGGQYHFKGAYFYRIVKDFVDQAGPQAVSSVFGGAFKDDPGGLKRNHTHLGLLSMANSGPNTNGASFFILINAAPHLDGGYDVFGEIVDGHHIALEINQLASAVSNKELMGSHDAQIIDSGQLRRGTHWDDPAFKAVIEEERRRIASARSGGTR